MPIPDNIFIKEEVTIEDVKTLAAVTGMIFYGANTPWWTCESQNLYTVNNIPHGLPCDPLGGMLFQTDRPDDFFTAGLSNNEHYGKHGTRAFLLAYHGCVMVKMADGREIPTALRNWAEYNELIDRTEGK